MSNRYTKASLLTGTFMAGAMIVTPAYGQTDDPNDMTDQDNAMQASPTQADETEGDGGLIVVTGSRIARRNVETAAPIAVVQDEEFKLSGTVNVENVINTLPQVVPGFTSASNNPGNGTATLNLRGLGSIRTLVLVNGRRWMFFDTTQRVDLNTIPSFLIDSVDVVTGGASAVYGSDAVAGVVNFRLKNVEGIEAGGQYRITEEGDGGEYELHGAIGTSFDDGRGHATVFAGYTNRHSIFQRDRESTFFALGDDGNGGLTPGGSSTLPEGRLIYLGDGDTTGTDFDANGSVIFTAPGDFRTRNGELYNYAPANYLQIPQERYLLGGYADYEFADGHEFYTEVSFVNNRVAQELAATPVTGTFSVNLASVAPFLGASENAQLAALDASETGGADGFVDLFVQRRTTETGSRNTLDERNAFRVLGGVRGELTDGRNYDAYYMYARTRNSNIQAGNISKSAFTRGLDGTDPAINIFGPNTLTPTMVDQISILAQNGDSSILKVANAALSGTFGNFGMGADDIGFAIGAEYRKVGSKFIPDTALASGDVIGFNAGSPTEGSYNVKEVFAELNLPILGPDSGIERLELTAAARYSDYSLASVGGVWTYAGGIEFSPIRDVTFRGQYQRAVRAPNVGELFQGQAIGFPPATDPCSAAAAVAAGPLRDTCIATGVPAARLGTDLALGNSQIPALFGGNPNLQEETSDSWTAGIVLQPSFIPGFVLTADYFNIKIDGAIFPLGGGLNNALDLCYNKIQDVNSAICQIFVGKRNAQGSIVTANPPLISTANIGGFKTDGVDLEMSYSTSLPFSLMTDTGEQKLQLSFLGTWTHENSFVALVDDPTSFQECAGNFGLVCGNPTPKWKWTSRASFIDGPLTTSLRWRHLSAVDDDTGGFSVNHIPSYDIFDLSFSFDVSEQLSLAMGVENLFDKSFTLLGSNQEQSNTYPSVYDVIGRSYFASASFKF
jgi:outer membrane receptor protein involved in Fe transport